MKFVHKNSNMRVVWAVIPVFLIVSLIGIQESFAEKEIEMLVSPIVPRLIPSNEPVDSLIVRDIRSSPVWDGAQKPIVGLDFVEGNAYHIIAKKADSFQIFGNKKYELVEIIQIFKPHKPYSWKSLCVPGYLTSPDGDCVFAFRCSEVAYPGKPCTINMNKQEYLKPIHQHKVGILPEDVICLETLQLVVDNNNSPKCVKYTSVDKLLERGFTLMKSNNDSPYD